MTTFADFVDTTIEMLKDKGYATHQGQPDDGADLDGHWWFSWGTAGMSSYEVGDTVDDEFGAWELALQHWFLNAEIPTERL